MQTPPLIRVALVDDDPHCLQMFVAAVDAHPAMALAFTAGTGQEMLDWLQDNGAGELQSVMVQMTSI